MERKVQMFNLPTELKKLSLKEKVKMRKCFLDEAEEEENGKENLPWRRNRDN